MVFLLLSGLFLGSLAMLNILGITRIIDIPITDSFALKLTVGVLPYPITFLCTDFISEIYGRKRANAVVWVGLIINAWVLFILWLGGVLPPVHDLDKIVINPETGLPGNDYVFYSIRHFTFITTVASMFAYLAAQFCDVHIFHYLKKLTNGKHLWLRNNGSTLISQMVDSFCVIIIAQYYAQAFDNEIYENGGDTFGTLFHLIISGYLFKLVAALLDTIPFYLGTNFLNKYLAIEEPDGLHH
jgi:uncharacterized integral membrane protein (TIGR00697 family)